MRAATELPLPLSLDKGTTVEEIDLGGNARDVGRLFFRICDDVVPVRGRRPFPTEEKLWLVELEPLWRAFIASRFKNGTGGLFGEIGLELELDIRGKGVCRPAI